MPADLSLAVLLSTGELGRLYTGLSLLVSSAAEGQSCAALASFEALALLLDPDLPRRAQEPDATTSLSSAGRETFARSLAGRRDSARELEGLAIYACSASVETMGLSEADIEGRLDGVMSTPRFLRETADARLVVV